MTNKIELRGYQKNALDEIIKYHESNDIYSGLVVMPIASGKSFLIAHLVKYLNDNKLKVLIVQNRIEELDNNITNLKYCGIDGTIYSSSFKQKDISDATYTMFQMINKYNVQKLIDYKFDVIIIDDANYGYRPKTNKSFGSLFSSLKSRRVIGFTSDPYRPYAHGVINNVYETLKVITRTVSLL